MATAASVDLGQVVEELAEFYQPIAEDAGAELQIGIAKDIHVNGHRSLIQQSLANLIENAIKYGRPVDPTGRHRVSVRAGDVLVLPAGTGHCQIDANADFQVCGAYPPGQQRYETLRAEHPHDKAVLERIRAVPLPGTDPVFGAGGLLARLWTS